MGIVELSETVFDSYHNSFGIAILNIVSFADPTLFLTFLLFSSSILFNSLTLIRILLNE